MGKLLKEFNYLFLDCSYGRILENLFITYIRGFLWFIILIIYVVIV